MPTFTSPDGLTLAYHEWGSGRPDSGPPVVLQHGFIAGTEWNWVRPGIVDRLVGAGHHVVALDARGHGASATPHDSAFYGEQKMAGDLSALFDVLGVPEVHLVGYSMGAIISLIAASEDRRVGRLVVGGVGAGVVELGGVDTRAIPNDLLVQALLVDDAAAIEHPVAQGFRAFADVVGADRRALAAQARVVHASPIPLDLITAPTLVVAGTDDELAARPEVLAAAIPRAEVVRLPGDHMGVLAADDFVPSLLEFLHPSTA